MILRVLKIALAMGAVWAIWTGFQEIRVLRGTVFWEFRYLLLVVSAFLALSGVEWIIGWITARLNKTPK